MPTEEKTWVCKKCGTRFREEGHAINCERSHLQVEDMKIGHAEVDTDERRWKEQEIWPTILYVKCMTRAIDGATYRLVKQTKTREHVVQA